MTPNKMVIPLIQSAIQMVSILAMDNIQPSTVMHGTKDIPQLGTSYISLNLRLSGSQPKMKSVLQYRTIFQCKNLKKGMT